MSPVRVLALVLALAALALPASAGAAGTLTVLSASDVDYLDPGHTYYTIGYAVQGAIHRTLYAARPQDPLASPNDPVAVPEIVPDVAAAPPEITDGGRTVVVRLRTGVRYSPPVNREVTSHDIAYAFARAASRSVSNEYTIYFEDLVGFPRRLTRTIRAVRGIETPDDHTVVFRLRRPTGVAFAAALVLPITAPVPEEYARRFDRRTESTYGNHAAFTGPYRVLRYVPGTLIQLGRNPNWDQATDPFRTAALDAITYRANAVNLSSAARQTATGRGIAMLETPPTGLIASLGGAVHYSPGRGTRFFPLRTDMPPLNRLHVRRAILAALDRQALVGTRGPGQVATHLIPPGVPGADEFGPSPPYLANPRGDLALARAELRAAGYRDGRLHMRRPLLLVTAKTGPGRAVADAARRQLARIGLRLRVKRVAQDSVYTDWCQIPRRRVAICGAAGWFIDFPDGVEFLSPIVDSHFIFRAGGNNNLALLRSRAVDRALAAGRPLPAGPDRNAAAAAADRAAIDAAAVAPFMWDVTALVASPDVRGQVSPEYGLWDLSTLSVGN